METTWQDQLGQLYREHRRGLFALALSVTRCRQTAEDAVHEAFARLCRLPAKKVGPDSALANEPERVAYAYRAVKNAAVDQWRRQKTQHTIREGLAQQPPLFDRAPVSPAAASEADESKARLMNAIEALPEADQQAVLLKVYGGLSIEQIAQALAQSRTTVSSRYHRALKKLRAILEPSEPVTKPLPGPTRNPASPSIPTAPKAPTAPTAISPPNGLEAGAGYA